MAPFPVVIEKKHPNAYLETHSHFRPTPFTLRPYSAACVPFRWMLAESAQELATHFALDLQLDREPGGGINSRWIEERSNQLVMLDAFFGALHPDNSLCFFYARDTPLSESAKPVIVGIGLVKTIDNPEEYRCSTNNPPHRSAIWERNVGHSIRPGFKEGFLFPYHQLFEDIRTTGLDPEEYLAFVPDDALHQFSYGSEHVSHDQAVSSMLICLRTLERIDEVCPGPWEEPWVWLSEQLDRLQGMRGPYPGFGSALTAFLGPSGSLFANALAKVISKDHSNKNIDLWNIFERIMQTLEDGKQAGHSYSRIWRNMEAQRRELLKLLSRFSLTSEQALRFFEIDNRTDDLDEQALLGNPYLLYENDRTSPDPISVTTIDRGMLPDNEVLTDFPLADSSQLSDNLDPRRVRALLVAALEQAADHGHTLLPRVELSNYIEAMPLETACPIGKDVLSGLRKSLEGPIKLVEMSDGSTGYQLLRFAEMGAIIRQTVGKRLAPTSRRHHGHHDLFALLDDSLGNVEDNHVNERIEEDARRERVAALEEMFASRLSVLVGAAGTGKTTLLNLLCRLGEVKEGGILLLAPTGKARVQLEAATAGIVGAQTVAQFLMKYGNRYRPDTGRYIAIGNQDRCGDYQTVIVDECSMLTEEQLASLLDSLTGVERLVLVGDTHQLPPIGSGRPFVDIVRELEPVGIERRFPQVDRGYAKLTVPRRQRGRTRADLLLADWFGGVPDPGADEIWGRLESEEMDEVRFESWTDYRDLQEKLLEMIVKELHLESLDDERGFECSLGGRPGDYDGKTYFRRRCTQAENWQILSPVRGTDHGVAALNRVVQQTFRKVWLSHSTSAYRRTNRPIGPQGIIYGDKVINLKNSGVREVYPRDRPSYVANGDVGIVVGHYKSQKQTEVRPLIKVEFASQSGQVYDFPISEFAGDKGSPPLELAYALTVHKSQGSEFGTTFVVLPNPCWTLSRELLYTALTRQENRIVILHQGDLRHLRQYASDKHSDIVRRITNLFDRPNPVSFNVESIEKEGARKFLAEKSLIHRTNRGEFVRSKSEVIIANELLSQGIDWYEYEAALRLPDGSVRYPDFTILDDDTGVRYYWEHLGLLHSPGYEARWNRKLAAYRNASIFPHDEGGGRAGTLIVTRDDERGGIDAQAISKLIREVLVA